MLISSKLIPGILSITCQRCNLPPLIYDLSIEIRFELNLTNS